MPMGPDKAPPDATQVADRFHRLQNLAEAFNQVFNAHGEALWAVSMHACIRGSRRNPGASS
jgi:hypothetical protein